MSTSELGKELKSSLKSALDFLKRGDKRSASQVQMKIVINRYMDDIVEKLNSFLFDINSSPDEKINVVMETLPLVTDILNHLPNVQIFEESWHKYSALSNFLRMNLANFNVESDHVRVISSANLLGQLLIGDVPHLNELPEMPDFDDPLKYFDKFAIIYNTLQTTCGVYQSLLDSLSTIAYKDLIEWSKEGLWHFKLLFDLLFSQDLKQLLKTKKIKKMSKFYENQYNFTVQFSALLQFILSIHSKLGGKWPEELLNYGLLQEFTIPSYLSLIVKLRKFTHEMLSDIEWAYNANIINKNDHWEQSEHYIIVDITLDSFDQYEKYILLYENKVLSSDLNRLTDFYNINIKLIEKLINFGGGRDNIINSYLVTFVLDIFKSTLPFLAHEALLTKSADKFENIHYEYRFILDKFDISQDTTLFLVNVLSRLYIYSHLESGYDLSLNEIYEELKISRDFLMMKPRNYIAASILTLILSIIIDKDNHDYHNQIINEILSNSIEDGMQYHLRNEVFNYLGQISQAKQGETPDFSPFMHRLQQYEFDTFSWLIPDFSKLCLEIGIAPIIYIPFNRESDAIDTYHF
jgi:hypothetical protein